jgi:hypothetical protein
MTQYEKLYPKLKYFFAADKILGKRKTQSLIALRKAETLMG